MTPPVSLATAPIRDLGKRLRAGEFSALELASFFLERLERLGPSLNAVATLTRDLALTQAAQADQELAQGKDRGPLHGIPYGAKDLLATEGIPTSWGAECYRGRVLEGESTVTRRLREAGAVLVAKLAMVEIAGGLGYTQPNASMNGPGVNPWNQAAWSGGSSSGSGSAVGAGLVPFAIGSETWGSIMTPAAYCGVTGLRPTYGRVSRHAAMALSWSMDKLGPLARDADDCELVLAAIAGPDPEDPTAAEREFRYLGDTAQGPLKLATLKGVTTGVQAEVAENYEHSLEILRPIATFEEIELPDLPYGAVASTIIDCELAAAFEGLLKSGEIARMTAPEDRLGLYAPQWIPAKDYINALRVRKIIQRAIDLWLSPFDALVAPTMAAVASPLEGDFREYFGRWPGSGLSGAENAAGIPAISVPNGFGERRLPTGLLFVGRAFDEAKLLAIARRYQSETDWHTRIPDWASGPAK